MISSSDMDAYRSQVDRLADSASVSIRTYLDELIGDHDGREIDVAEIREATIAALDGILDVYATAAASAACDFMESHGMPPQTLADKDRDAIERTVRYQAGKLVDGDTEGFIEQVRNFARDAVVFSANHQQIKAAEAGRKHRRRHRGKGGGIRFARVPSGTETCTFCRMLASRGFVYWSRETAGELDHFHRGCDCRVVVSDDPDDPEGVEGFDPDRERELWKRFEEIDAKGGLSSAEKAGEKRAVIGAAGPPVTYEKPLSAFAHEAGGARDVEAHEVLRAAGHAVVVRKENAPEGFLNIDLLLDGRLCKLKGPTSEVAGINGLRFIERNIGKAVRQFEKAVGGPVKPSIVVLNCVGMRLSRADAPKRVWLEMGGHDIDRVILLTDGGIDDLKK